MKLGLLNGSSRRVAWAGICALLLATTVSCGVQAEPQPSEQEMEALPEDPEALFQNLARDPVELTDLVSADGSQAAVDQAFAQLVSSERAPGWETAGVDITEAIRQREGGLNGNILLFDPMDAGHAQATFYGADDPRSFVRPTWVLVATYSQASSGPDLQVDVTSFSRGIKIVARSRSTKVGNARCYTGGDLWVYRDTTAPVTEEDVALLITYGAFMRATRDLEMCVYYEASGDRLAYRAVTRDGRKIAAIIGDTLRGRIAPITENPFPTSR